LPSPRDRCASRNCPSPVCLPSSECLETSKERVVTSTRSVIFANSSKSRSHGVQVAHSGRPDHGMLAGAPCRWTCDIRRRQWRVERDCLGVPLGALTDGLLAGSSSIATVLPVPGLFNYLRSIPLEKSERLPLIARRRTTWSR
jgi:hypothetical protein